MRLFTLVSAIILTSTFASAATYNCTNEANVKNLVLDSKNMSAALNTVNDLSLGSFEKKDIASVSSGDNRKKSVEYYFEKESKVSWNEGVVKETLLVEIQTINGQTLMKIDYRNNVFAGETSSLLICTKSE